eukprot:CAMPEP_0168404714 /NCGR_PEP_ID=MMETSP0228-20121227/24778_1 /TAXON_ID=133427 /ORGANISM="Protoceratium reticulatum, Strain CCCM 535 (=CCMP 1889)" /LENGTH=40 /DNA_ID= /DNA_START= /DNA_END= /DNA_ORIENTATION=
MSQAKKTASFLSTKAHPAGSAFAPTADRAEGPQRQRCQGG